MQSKLIAVIVSCAAAWFLALLAGARPGHSAAPASFQAQSRVRQAGPRLHPDVPQLTEVAVDLPSMATGSPVGTLALSVHYPSISRFAEGAPVVIWVHGGYDAGRLQPEIPPAGNDFILILFLFPGGEDPTHGRFSDGVYDNRGADSILALRDVILFAAGRLADDRNRTIDDIVATPVMHDNIGLVGKSNSGNILSAVATLHGPAISDHLKYLILWESPFSSQIATRDLGRPILQPGGGIQGEYENPRRLGYGRLAIPVDFDDLAFDPAGPLYRVFHDGNGDGHYTTIARPGDGLPTPDLDLDGVLELDEDFPLDTYPSDDGVVCYSRPVTRALDDRNVIPGGWPDDIAPPDEAAAYWDLREGVRLLPLALDRVPDLEGMLIATVRDHVQAPIDKPNIRQAFETWRSGNGWVQINPSPAYMVAADDTLAGHTGLPSNPPNTPPHSWGHPETYCIGEDIPDDTGLLAAVWQMADRAAAR